ncbi:restriction endonuclease [Solibacillus isronensis]|uniref:restriction endonuclease n=1 Tax=Solibacillus isronensis TaxID=412383 RepID=UPI0009A58FA9|nr:restriction endonuclease [Solibacillus isronensis]
MNGLQYMFEEYTRNEWLIIALLPLLLMSIFALSRSVTLSKNVHIKKYVATIDPERLASHIPSMKDVKILQQQLKTEGLDHSSLTIRQAITFAVGERRKEKRSTVDIASIDTMSGVQFEKFLHSYFSQNGYRVSLTKTSGDQGVDLILYKEERKIAVQCKRYKPSNRVTNTAVQEVLTGKIYYDCTEAWVITTSTYTPHAIRLANKVGVRLIDRAGLIKLLKD